MAEGGFYVIGIRRFGEVLAGTQLDRFDRRVEAGKTGQHHNQHRRIMLVQHLYTSQAGGIAFQLQVDHRIAGIVLTQEGTGLFQVRRQQYGIAAPFKGTAERTRKRRVIFNDQQ
ncbi:hypothetical protein D3C81_1768000 [compost metagenome]